MNGSGSIETVGLDAGVHFDLSGNGFREKTGWISPENGLLVLDRNGDGIINDGSELFGNWTLLESGYAAANGFYALADFDDNGDGFIDTNDAIFSDLRIWRDLDQDGFSDQGELFTLEELGIARLSVNYENSNFVDAAGNEHRQVGSFITESGEERLLTDIWFQRNVTLTLPGEVLDVPQEIALLPDAVGYGNTYSLHQAMVRDETGTLQSLVEDFVAEADPNRRKNLVTDILFTWAGQTEADKNRFRGYEGLVDGRKIGVLEAFLGHEVGGPRGSGQDYARIFHGLYGQWEDAVFYQLMAGSHLADIFKLIPFTHDKETDIWTGQYEAASESIMENLIENPASAAILIPEYLRTVSGINPYAGTNLADATAALMAAGQGHNAAFTAYWQSLLESGDQETQRQFAEFMISGQMASILSDWTWGRNALVDVLSDPMMLSALRGHADIAGELADELFQSATVIRATPGNQTLHGHDGADIMTGHDEGINRLYGGAGDDLLIAGKNDRLYGGDGNDTLIGAEGSILDGGAGNDTLIGAEGSVLYGRSGDNLLVAANNTVLHGGSGNDTYRIGADVLNVTLHHNSRDGLGIIEFGEGISLEDARLERHGNHLHMLLGERQMVMQNWFSQARYQVGEFHLADGTVLNATDWVTAQTLHSEALPGNQTLRGHDGVNIMTGHDEGINHLHGGAGDDLLIAGKNDRLYGGDGNDTLIGAEGSILDGGAGNDTLIGAEGSVLYGRSGDNLLVAANNTVLHGGSGNDTYRIGADVLNVTLHHNSRDGLGIIEFGEGISLEDARLERHGNHLHMLLGERQMVMQNWFSQARYQVGEFHLADGTVLNATDWVTAQTLHSEALPGNQTLRGHDGVNIMTGHDEGINHLHGGAGDDLLIAGKNDRLYGGDGNDTLIGAEGSILDGGAGNDTLIGAEGSVLYGRSGDNLLVAANNTVLHGGSGNDTYRIGADVLNVTLHHNSRDGLGIIEFGEGISLEDARLERHGNHLHMLLGERQMVMQNWFSQARYQVGEFHLADGTVLNATDWVTAQTLHSEALPGNQTLRGHDGVNIMTGHDEGINRLHGGAGDDLLIAGKNDRLYGGDGNDTLIGADGTSYLYGGDGDDILIGGRGNDFLEGGHGDDTYLFSPGDGQDVIRETSGFDRILFDGGLGVLDVAFFRNGNHLEIGYGSGTDKVTVSNHFAHTNYRVEEVHLTDDGAYLTSSDIDAIIQQMSAYAVKEGIALDSLDAVRRNESLMTMVSASWQPAA